VSPNIHYTAAGLLAPKVGADSNDATIMKSNTGWPRNKYLNIWVIKCIDLAGSRGQCNILGFATFPLMSTTDQGVVVMSGYFGLPNQSQTTTHEIGHYLNLLHTFHFNNFQDGCAGLNNSNCGTSGDRVCDTPPTRQRNYGSARRQNTCFEPDLDTTGGDRPDQVRNYMDYVDDSSMDIFTDGQRRRMFSALNTASDRKPLWQASNLLATGTGPYGRIKANFALQGCDQPPCYVCPGQQLNLTSYSTGKPSSFTWQIRQGSTVISSSNTGPCTQMTAPTNPGTYDIRLQVSNLAARTADTTYTGFLIVRDPAQAQSYPFSEGFEGSTFPPAGWVYQNPDFATGNSNLTWERFNSTGRGSFGASNAMARLRNFVYYNRTQRDHLITPLIDIPATAENPAIEFDVYYRALYWENTRANQYGYLYGDTLAVYISKDCGTTWQRLYHKGGEDLDVTGSPIQVIGRNISSNDQAVPPSGANTDWRHEIIYIPSTYKGEKVLIRFENITEMGNNLFTDSIQVREASTTALVGSRPQSTLTLTPNPTSQEAYLIATQAQGTLLHWTLYNTLGQALLSGEASLRTADERVTLPTHSLPAGLYVIKAQLGSETFLMRLVKE